jgi:hypothetical protein
MRRILGRASNTGVIVQRGAATATSPGTGRLFKLRNVPSGRIPSACASTVANGFTYDVVALGKVSPLCVTLHAPRGLIHHSTRRQSVR